MAKARLTALKYPKDVVADVSRLVELHLRFHGYGTGEWTDSAVRRYVRDAGPLLERLHKLTRSDCTTRNKRRAAALSAAYDDLEERIDALRRAGANRRAATRTRRVRDRCRTWHPAWARCRPRVSVSARAQARCRTHRQGRRVSCAAPMGCRTRSRQLLAVDRAGNEVGHCLTRVVVAVLHRRALHEVAGRRVDRSADTAVLRDHGGADCVDDDPGAVR